MTPLAFILCLACKALPADGQDTAPPEGVTLPAGEEMFEFAWMYSGHDLRAGPYIEKSARSKRTVSLRPNNGLKMVDEGDTDEDGVVDERYTEEELSPTTMRRRLERRAGPDAPWVVEYDDVGRAGDVLNVRPETKALIEKTELEKCLDEMPQRFPTDVSEPRYGTEGVVIPYDRAALGRCTPDQGLKLKVALECVRHKTDFCLAPLNPYWGDKLRALVDATQTKAVVACIGECGVAQTKLLRRGGTVFEGIELPVGFQNLPANSICEFLFHELLHAVHMPKGKDHDTKGNDALYACARVCSGCSHASIGAGDDHKDCAVCASPIPNKAECGVKPQVAEARIPDDPASCGRLDGDRFTLAAGERHRVDVLYCDGTPAPPLFGPTQLASCIEKCPDGFTVAGTGAAGWCRDFRPPEEQGSSCKASEPLWLCTA